jgi:hypothetical protein
MFLHMPVLCVCLQVSYGMTECCGKISMSIQPYDWPDQLQQLLQEARQAGGEDAAAAAAAEAAFYDQLLERVCTSGRPFLLMEVSSKTVHARNMLRGCGYVADVL